MALVCGLIGAAVFCNHLAKDMENLHNPPTNNFPAPKVSSREIAADRHTAYLAMGMAIVAIVLFSAELVLKGMCKINKLDSHYCQAQLTFYCL